RAEQRRVENLSSIRRGNDDDAGVRLEPVHFDEHLIQGLLTLVVPTAKSQAAAAPHRVDLVDKDDARRNAFCLVEQVADATGSDADEHLHEFGARDIEEGDAGFTSHGAGEERFACAGWADQQYTMRQVGAERGKLLGIFEELDDFLELALRLVHASHILEADA